MSGYRNRVNLQSGKFLQLSPQFRSRVFVRGNHECTLFCTVLDPHNLVYSSCYSNVLGLLLSLLSKAFSFQVTCRILVSHTGTNSLLHHQPRHLQMLVMLISIIWTCNSRLCISHQSHRSRSRMSIFSQSCISEQIFCL